MQLTDLKQLTPTKAVEALCQCDNETLNSIACESRGRNPEIYYFTYPKTPGGWWEAFRYTPTDDLNQAYELLEEVEGQWSCHFVVGDGRWFRMDYIGQQLARMSDGVKESEAGSHARAVTILAIVGLVIGGGA